MKIAVCIKQVPDTEARLRLASDGKWIEEEDLPFVINESDECALEEALQIGREDRRRGGGVQPRARSVREERCARRWPWAPSAPPTCTTPPSSAATRWRPRARCAAAIGREPFDLVLTGSQSDDLGWGVTGSLVAGRLGWPHAWLVMGIEIEDGGARRAWCARWKREERDLPPALPAVLEVQAGINHPRYASLKGIMQAKRKEIAEPTPADLGLDAERVGRRRLAARDPRRRLPARERRGRDPARDPAAAASNRRKSGSTTAAACRRRTVLRANALARVLAYSFASRNRQTFINSLSVAGADGTLDKRFKDGPFQDLRGRVCARAASSTVSARSAATSKRKTMAGTPSASS